MYKIWKCFSKFLFSTLYLGKYYRWQDTRISHKRGETIKTGSSKKTKLFFTEKYAGLLLRKRKFSIILWHHGVLALNYRYKQSWNLSE